MTISSASFPSPWMAVTPEAARYLEKELERELSLGHALHGIRAVAIARRPDRDEVLFQLPGSQPRYAEVHLTYQVESSPDWPRTRIFESLTAWSTPCESDVQ